MLLEGGTTGDVREFASRNFADPQGFLTRIAEIAATAQESFDLLELAFSVYRGKASNFK